MPDPLEELSNFDPGASVSPIPAAEVRRRGDRLRRRNTTLVVGGAVAAVLLAAVPVAVFAGGGGGSKSDVDVAITPDNLLNENEVPARDRLRPWEEIDAEGPVLACAPDDASLDAETELRRDFGADIDQEGPAGDYPVSVVRTSVLEFDGPADAERAYDQAQGWIVGCPGGDDLARKAVSTTPVDVEDGRGEWRLHEFYATDICTECDAIRFDRMGVAQFRDRVVLVSLAEIGGPLVPEGLEQTMEELFTAAVTKADGAIAGAGQDALDFPIETGLPAADADVELAGPGPDVEGVTLPKEFCDDSVWPPSDPTGRLAVQVTGPEYSEWRELLTFGSEDAAAAVVDDLRTVVEGCREAGDLTFATHDVEASYDETTFSYTFNDGLGGVVYQVFRVGHAVMATAQYAEWSPETAETGAQELNGSNSQLAQLMCEYTEEGC